jgi:hypothetical protein
LTTIAYRDGVMAADTQVTDLNVAFHTQKIWRLPDGGVVAACGAAAKGFAGIKWMLDGEHGDPPSIEEATLVIARPDGSLWVADNQFPAFPLLDHYYATGCGRDFALKALADGKSAVEAVFAAAQHDLMTEAPVMSLAVVPRDFPEVEMHYPKGKASGRKRRANQSRR